MAGQPKKSSKIKPKKQSRFRRAVKIVFWTFLAVFCSSLVTAGIIGSQRLADAEKIIPTLTTVMADMHTTPSVIVSSDGEELYVVQDEFRKSIEKIEDVPQVVLDATIAAEDKRFYDHDGVDYTTMVGIGYQYLKSGESPRGGSTLTMQIAKLSFTSSKRSIDRKLDDIALAIMIERTLTKDQILMLYLNRVYYGERAYGIGAAAKTYFGKELSELTLSEAATLARLVRRPSKENPFVDKDVAIKNRNVVLKLMLDQELISKSDHDAAKKEELKLTEYRPLAQSGKKHAPYFVDSVLRKIEKEFPNINLGAGGFRIETTLNWELQEQAEKIIEDAVKSMSGQKVTTAAIIVLDSDGRIIAHVGGADYKRNQYDVVWQGKRQPGSSFKPFMYATAFKNNVVSPYDMISNEKYYWEKSWGNMTLVRNSNGKYGGEVSVEYAIKHSINVVAARVIEMTGPESVVRTARSAFGFTSHLEAVPALALGATAVSPLEMARGYSVFKTGGDRLEPWQIVRIVGPDGHTIKRYTPKTRRNVLSRSTAMTMDTILYETAHGGTAWRVTSNEGVVNARGKTGTTNNSRDAWLCGYTDEFVAVGWVGSEVREDGAWVYQSMNRVFGGTSVAPFWGKIVKKAQDIYGEKKVRFNRYFPLSAVQVNLEVADGGSVIIDLPPLDPDTIPPIRSGGFVINLPDNIDPPDDGTTLSIVFRRICSDTKALATVYCPNRPEMAFRSGQEPKDDCPIHGPPR